MTAPDPGSAPPVDSSAPSTRARIGIFGGSFDPVHRGHLHAARAAQRAHALDRVVFVPAAQPPHKSGRVLAPGRHRVAMLQRALAGTPDFEIDTSELDRGGTSYTIDTVRALRGKLGPGPELYLIVGSDNLTGLAQWKEVGALLAMVEPVVVHRVLDAAQAAREAGAAKHERDPATDRAIAEIRGALGVDAARRLERGYLSLPPVHVSSTDLRAEIPGLALECRDLPSAVLEYIRAERLYGAGCAR
jgi:nicotinate-nucleotide adenylyltransferase